VELVADQAENVIECETGETIESPFEKTAYLRRGDATIEVDIPKSTRTPTGRVLTRLAPDRLLLLRG
jgi:hypothetical protein